MGKKKTNSKEKGHKVRNTDLTREGLGKRININTLCETHKELIKKVEEKKGRKEKEGEEEEEKEVTSEINSHLHRQGHQDNLMGKGSLAPIVQEDIMSPNRRMPEPLNYTQKYFSVSQNSYK